MVKVKTDLIKFEKDCYPRVDGVDNNHLDLLRSARSLPPIVVNQDMILVDGYHRLTLALMEKKPEVEVKVENIPREKILERATKLNARHGKQLSLRDKKYLVRRLSQDGQQSTSALASLLSISTRVVNKWNSDIRATREKDRNEKILDLYLEGRNKREIGKQFKLHESTIGKILDGLQKGIDSQIQVPDPPQIGDVWLFSDCDDSYGLAGYPGRIPGQIVENLLHFYTKPFDLVIDPMAGGGTTLDVCKAMYRCCLPYDMKVMRDVIRQNDIKGGIPIKSRKGQFVILDPPYYKKKDEAYYPGSISALDQGEYLSTFEKIAKESYRVLSPGSYLALVISNYLDEEAPEKSIWTWDYIHLLKRAKFTPVREIQCPLTSQSLHPAHVEDFRGTKRMAKLTRSIIVFRKPDGINKR